MHFFQPRTAPANPVSRSLHWFAITAIALWVVGAAATSVTAQPGADFEPTWFMVVDKANLLNEEQEVSAINDTWRLNLLGIPVQVVTELDESTPELAQQRAEALRVEHAIESFSGAGDGILMYAAVNPANRSLINVAIAAGPNALPNGGLTQDDLASIESSIVLPQLGAGHPARAIVYSVREMIYQQIFTPPPSAPQAGWKTSAKDILPWLAPFVAIPVAVVSLRNAGVPSEMRVVLGRAAPPLVGGLLLALIAITVRSAPCTFWAIGLILVSVTVLILGDREQRRSDRHLQPSTPQPPLELKVVAEAGS